MIKEVFDRVHEAEKANVNGKTPWRFYMTIFFLPIVLSAPLAICLSSPSSRFVERTITVLSIIIGLLITSLVPFLEIAANKILENEQKNKLSDLSNVRIKLMFIIYSVISFSIVLGLFGLILSFLVSINFDSISNNILHSNFIYSEYLISTLRCIQKLVIFLFYVSLSMNVLNLFNILRYANSLVIPVLKDLDKNK